MLPSPVQSATVALIASLLLSSTGGAQGLPVQKEPVRPRIDSSRIRQPVVDTAASVADTGKTITAGFTSGPKSGGPTAASITGVPGAGRYRVTLNGFTVLRQTYDNPLQLDGKGDELYFASWVALIDTASPNVVSHSILRSRDMGDRNGYAARVRIGSASGAGGVVTGDRYPRPTPYARGGKIAADSLPMVLWEGTLVPGRNAVVLTPTVWEWDNNPEIFAYWVVSRGAMLERLTEPQVLLSAINNTSWFPLDLGSPGFLVHTNMFADARDRPIGLELGRPAENATFATPAPVQQGQVPLAARAFVHNVTALILKLTRIAQTTVDRYSELLEKVIRGSAFGAFVNNGSPKQLALFVDPAAASDARARFTAMVDSMRAAAAARRSTVRTAPLHQMAANFARSVVRDYSARDLYFFEKTLVLTPQAIEGALQQASTAGGRPRGSIDIPYSDHAPLQGRYILHLQVEKLP